MPQATDPKLQAVTAEAIPVGVFVCLRSSDGSGAVRIATNTQADARGLLGYAPRAAAAGKSILLYGPGDVVPGFTGLTPGAQYWLDVSGLDTYSNLSADQWTRPVGVAESTTHLRLGFGDVVKVGGEADLDATETYSATTAVKIGDSTNNPTVDLPGSGAVTASGNPTFNLGTAKTTVGSLGIGADVLVQRVAANQAELGSGDSLNVIGAASLGVKTSSGDANATIGMGSGGLVGGAGGATAADVRLFRAAENAWEAGADDSLSVVGTAALGRKAATTDANATIEIGSSGLRMGAGGGSSPDVQVSRLAANVLGLAAGDSLQIGSVQIHAGTGAPSGDLSGALTTASGVYLRNDAASLATVLYVTHNTGTNWGAVTGA